MSGAIREVRDALLRAIVDRDRAERERKDLQSRLDALEEQEALDKLVPVEQLTAEALGERVADHARVHQTGQTDAPWRLMRRALRHLVARAEGRERSIPAADIALEVAHKYEGICIRADQNGDDTTYWRAKAEVAREIEKRLRGEP